MAAITKRLLHLRSTFYSHARPYPYTQHYFSSSSDRNDVPQSEQPKQQPSDSSSLNDVRASLRNQPPPPDRRWSPPSPFAFSRDAPPPSRGASRDEISARLAEFRSRSAPPPPSPPNPVSMQELYEKNMKINGESSTSASGFGGGGQSGDAIRQSLSKLQSPGSINAGGSPSKSGLLSRYTGLLKNKADPNANLTGGSGSPLTPFLKNEMGKGTGGVGSNNTLFGKTTHDRLNLGEKLRTMRPEKRKGKWFSLQELSDRLAKVRLADQKQLEKAGFPVEAVYQSFQKINQDKDQQKKDRARSFNKISLLGSMGAEARPPKDHLVEKYFHPDNMSSAEKMKLELQKVRDEFKMSESDCGSARVQVAQLTTKIKHLSTALHKKDKHSRKGLHEMVQRRKKLLKYLRRTDWDSYCLVLSKLGLRDNPVIKA